MHEIEWLAAITRWLHVVVGIVWIGTSFHLFSWEYKFSRGGENRPEVEGSLWMIQGGDFYHIERLRKEPERFPERLVWFKYEAYLTWLSGLILLILVYYVNARGMLVADSANSLPPSFAVLISLAAILLGWIAYQGFCKTRLAENLPLSAVLGMGAVSLLAFLFWHLFEGRAAFLHLGVLLGTIMSANVFFVIIPWHKSLIAAIKDKRPLEPLYDQHPGIRSDHNHYLALPVVFVMLSGHLPIAYSHPLGWMAISLCILAAGLIKHAHTLQQAGRTRAGVVFLVTGLALLLAASFLTRTESGLDCSDPVSFTEVKSVLSTNCARCHSANPIDPSLASAPNNVVFDTPEEIQARLDRIFYRAVLTRTMPPPNAPIMKDAHRARLACWIRSREPASAQ